MPQSGSSVLSSARVIAAATMVSRLTGLVRDMLLSQIYGLGWVPDAFNFAFQIPNLFRRLFGEGALAAAFIPVFTRTIENDGRPAAWGLLARALALMTVTLSLLIVAIGLVLLTIWLLAPPADPDVLASRRLLLSLTALMLPFMLTICIVALFSSVLNCLGSFGPAALTPVVLNVLMILGIVVLGPALDRAWSGGDAALGGDAVLSSNAAFGAGALGGDDSAARGDRLHVQIYGVAVSVVLAGLLQVALLLPVLRRYGVRLAWRLDLRDPHVRRVLGLMAPVLIGQGVLILGPFLDAQICWLFSRVADGPPTATWLGITFTYPLHEGALSALANAQRLYQFPLGVFAVSLAVAALPALTRRANRGDWPGWSAELIGSLRLAMFIGVLTGAMMTVWSEPIVRMLFEYRRFDAADTQRVAAIMFWYGLGLWAFCAQHIVLRGFYSLSDIRTPLRISCALLPVNLAISVALIWHPAIRASAFAIASAITSSASVLIGLGLLQRRVRPAGAADGTRDSRPLLSVALLSAVVRMFAAGAAAALLLALVAPHVLAPLRGLGPVWMGRSFETLAGLTLGAAMCLLIARMLGLPEPARWLTRTRRAGEPES